MDKSKIIIYYLVIIIAIIIEIIFLFEIPYYYYSRYLKYLKLIRIIFGFLIFLIDVYFRVVSITEILLDIKKIKVIKDKYFTDKNIFNLIDKILIISGFTISLVTLILNLIGVGLSTKYLKSGQKTDIENEYNTRSIFLLFENCLISIGWIYLSFYWGFNMANSLLKGNEEESNINKKEGGVNKDINENNNVAPPIGEQNENPNRNPSSENLNNNIGEK